jgi:hypothetical protein
VAGACRPVDDDGMVPGAGRLRQPGYLRSLPCSLLPPPHVRSGFRSEPDGRTASLRQPLKANEETEESTGFCLDLPSGSSAAVHSAR